MLRKNTFAYASRAPAQIGSGSSASLCSARFLVIPSLFLLLISGGVVFYAFNVDISYCLNPSSIPSSSSSGETSSGFIGEQGAVSQSN